MVEIDYKQAFCDILAEHNRLLARISTLNHDDRAFYLGAIVPDDSMLVAATIVGALTEGLQDWIQEAFEGEYHDVFTREEVSGEVTFWARKREGMEPISVE